MKTLVDALFQYLIKNLCLQRSNFSGGSMKIQGSNAIAFFFLCQPRILSKSSRIFVSCRCCLLLIRRSFAIRGRRCPYHHGPNRLQPHHTRLRQPRDDVSLSHGTEKSLPRKTFMSVAHANHALVFFQKKQKKSLPFDSVALIALQKESCMHGINHVYL